MNKYIKHFLKVITHKYYVGKECFKIGLYWQGIIHDLSKFLPSEFIQSAKYYQGTRSPLEAERETNGYSKVFVYHKARDNKIDKSLIHKETAIKARRYLVNYAKNN